MHTLSRKCTNYLASKCVCLGKVKLPEGGYCGITFNVVLVTKCFRNLGFRIFRH